MPMCASVWYVHLSTGAFDSQRPWIPLALEIQVVLSHLIWVLGLELGFSERAVHAHYS